MNQIETDFILIELNLLNCRDHNGIDVNAVYHQLNDTYMSDSDENQQPGTSTGTVTPAGCRRFVLHFKQ